MIFLLSNVTGYVGHFSCACLFFITMNKLHEERNLIRYSDLSRPSSTLVWPLPLVAGAVFFPVTVSPTGFWGVFFVPYGTRTFHFCVVFWHGGDKKNRRWPRIFFF